jgi:uncharacterized protein YdcH (DUF465 family)
MQEFEKCKNSNSPQKVALKKEKLALKEKILHLLEKKTCTFFSTLALI